MDNKFPKSDKVNSSKVTFVNRYGITLAADMYPLIRKARNIVIGVIWLLQRLMEILPNWNFTGMTHYITHMVLLSELRVHKGIIKIT